MTLVDVPIAPSITFLSAGAGDVDVAGRARDLQAMLLAEDGRVELFDADIARFRRRQIYCLHGILSRGGRSRRSAQQRLVRARRSQS